MKEIKELLIKLKSQRAKLDRTIKALELASDDNEREEGKKYFSDKKSNNPCVQCKKYFTTKKPSSKYCSKKCSALYWTEKRKKSLASFFRNSKKR